MSEWSHEWLPIHMPAATSACTRDGLAAAFCPMLNMVARSPAVVRAVIMAAAVLALGPSSYVRAT